MPILLELLPQDGIRMHRIASTHGGEYVGPCPLCGGVDRFHVWPQQGDGGRWWCRGCEKSGDVIQYLRDVRKLSYLQACLEAGKEPEVLKRSFDWGKAANTEGQGHGRKWDPREIAPPPCEWIRKCSAFVDWCHEKLLKEAGILAYLKDCRGLSEDTIKAFHLGWNPQNLSRGRELWGLKEKLKEDGSKQDIWLPQGVVIPYYADGILQRARIRRLDPHGHNPKKGPPYCVVSGSSTAAMIPEDICKVLVVVESEFDAILLNQEAGHLAGIIALGSAQTRPDKRATELLRAADLILVSLDSDDNRSDGKNPGAKEAWGWWMKHFDRARRLPPIDGKDPGEMWKAGVDLSEWIRIGIEKYSGQNGKSLDNTTPIQGPVSQPLATQSLATQPLDTQSITDIVEKIATERLEAYGKVITDTCYEWIEKNRPEFIKAWLKDWDWIDEVCDLLMAGRSTIDELVEAFDIFQEGWMEASRVYRECIQVHIHTS